MTTFIVVKNQVEGIHYYGDAPEEVSFLRQPHRHIFNVETEIEVFHDDRELEFFMTQRVIDKWLKAMDLNKEEGVPMSCEMIAKHIIRRVQEVYGDRDVTCKVFEDKENGAKVVFKRDC